MAWNFRNISSKLGHVRALLGAFIKESESEVECLSEVDKKRKIALERDKERSDMVRKYGGVLSDRKDVDRYADDERYRDKQYECHQRHSLFRRALKGE